MRSLLKLIFLTLVSSQVFAANVNLSPTGFVDSIEDISIGDVVFNVSVVRDNTFSEVFNLSDPNKTPYFWNNPSGAENAANEIASSLEDVAGIINDSFFIPFKIDELFPGSDMFLFGWADSSGTPSNDPIAESLTALDSVMSTTGFAVFDEITVPIPAAFWLFGSALLGLRLIKRKKA